MGFFPGIACPQYPVDVGRRSAVALKIPRVEPLRPVGEAPLRTLAPTYAANRAGRSVRALGPVERDQSNGASAPGDGAPIAITGQPFATGVGVAAPSLLLYRLAKRCTSFSAQVGVTDDTAGAGSVVFQLWADGERLFDSGTMTGMSPAQSVNVDVTGKRKLKLLVTNAGDGSSWDRAVWADAKLSCDP